MTIADRRSDAQVTGLNILAAINTSIAQNTGEEHMIEDHGDTIATGVQLNELVGGGMTVLHGHTGVTPYTDRGDPSSWDFNKTDFITDGAYHTLDLSSIVPQGVTLVHLLIHALTAYNNSLIIFRKKGNVNDVNREIVYVRHGNNTYLQSVWVACDTDRKIEYWTTNVAWVSLDVMVRGWI